MLNPFHLNGIEAVLATVAVCLCVTVCVFISGGVTIKVAERICQTVENVAGAVSVAAQSIWGSK